MKKFLFLILCLALLGGSFTSFADIIVDEDNGSGGFGDNNIEVEDTLNDEEIEASLAKPLFFNDFENCTFNGNDHFKLLDSGDIAYGKAIKAKFSGSGAAWAAWIGSYAAGGAYQWNEQTVHTFNEQIRQNTDYILAIDYKNTELETANSDNAISFAAQVDDPAFKTVNPNDFYHYLPVTGEWNTYAIKFNSSTATSVNMKINFAGSTATTWLDNYGIYEPVKFSVKGTAKEMNMLEAIYADGYVGKGSALRVAAPEGLVIKSAKMNGRNIDLVDGELVVSSVTGDIELNVASALEALNKNYLVKDGYVHVPKGESVNHFVKSALANETYLLTDSKGNAKPKDGIIYPGDKLTIKVNDTDYEEFGFKYLVDVTDSDSYVVSDVVYLLDCAYGKITPKEDDDLNHSGTITVSDVVLARRYIMNAETKYVLDETKLSAEKAKVATDAATYGITDETFNTFILNEGNRTRVANVMKKALRGENVTIATIGGSITEGSALRREPEGVSLGWAPLMASWWERMFPGQVTFVNAGISGTLSMFGNYRLEADVLCHNPDLLLIEFAVNDGGGGGSMAKAQESMVRRMMETNGAALQIFFTSVSQNGGGGQANYKPIGEHYEIPQFSPRDAFWGNTFQNADGNTYDFAGLTYDGTHPNVLGNAMVATLVTNYFNKVYENLNEISSQINAIPEETYLENTTEFMDKKGYDAGLMTEGVASADGKVTVTSFGDFQKNADSTSFRSNCEPMCGVKYSSGTAQPIVIDVDDCHVFGVFSETATNGAKVKIEVFKQGTTELLKTDSSVDTNYSGVSIRSHLASFESVEGVDVTIKMTPIIDSGRTVATLRSFYIS